MKYRAILFDFDGTLIHSLPVWLNAFHSSLASYGVQLTEDEVVARCFYRDWALVAQEFHIGSPAEFCARVELSLRTAFLTAELFPDAKVMIKRFRESGLATALVTSSPANVLGEALNRLSLYEFF